MTKAFKTLAWGVLFAASAGQTFAASAPETSLPNTVQTRFVDLTAGQNSVSPASVAAPSGAADANGAVGTKFIDLTSGAGAAATPVREVQHGRSPRMHYVDLTNGAAPPDLNALEDEPEVEPDRIVITADRLNDPYEESNRGRFEGHVWLHRRVIDPVERAHFATVPTPARDGLHNFLFNLETPSVLANDIFQGDISRAGDTLARFIVNTTLGLGGIIDVAGKTGMKYRDNDFGATLATYGVSDYPYLLIPVIGPSNPRDLSGKAVDFFLDPLRYVTLPGGLLTSVGRSGAHELDKRSVDVGELDMLANTAADPYAEERAMARKTRAEEVSGNRK